MATRFTKQEASNANKVKPNELEIWKKKKNEANDNYS